MHPYIVCETLTHSHTVCRTVWRSLMNTRPIDGLIPTSWALLCPCPSLSLSLSSSPGGIWTPNVAAPPTADWLTGPLGLWQRDTEACWAERMPSLYKSDYTVSSNCVRSTELKSGSFMWLATWWQVAIYLLHCSLLQFRDRRDGRKHLLLLYNYRLGFFW